jgi:hypothetical protein
MPDLQVHPLKKEKRDNERQPKKKFLHPIMDAPISGDRPKAVCFGSLTYTRLIQRLKI